MMYQEIRDSPATLSDRVVRDVELKILRGELQPGARLPSTEELEDALGVSRSVVRDAMRTLAARGLLDVRQGHGTHVADRSEALVAESLVLLLMRSEMTLQDVLAARAALEVALVPLAARNGTEEDWIRAEEYLDRFSEAVSHGEWRVAWDAHLGFHLSLLDAIHLPALTCLLAPLQHVILMSSLPPTIDDRRLWDVEAHYPILDGLRRGDEDGVRRALEQHFGFMDDPQYAAARTTLFRDVPKIEDVLATLRGNESPGLGGGGTPAGLERQKRRSLPNRAVPDEARAR